MSDPIKRSFFVGEIREWTVKDLLLALRQVSNAHVKNVGTTLDKWSIWEQIAHTHSEVSELYDKVKQGATPYFVMEEIFDIVFSGIVNGHVLGYSDEQLIVGLETTLDKIRRREGLIHD